ncbi:hypothetical protein DKX38_029054 [Salix brachista]|uniref:Squalene monooxygenase n=1 Tax=Salix brachista TaxID=2182728 RepID=A0A5N5J0R2_9ROSI|nr:hypothetical protein DKX38_029054 [Salix brachista]
MDSKHIFGGAVAAFLFGFVVLYSSRRREKIKASGKTPTKKNLKSSGNGVCRSNFAGNTDVIIVGAGVAGSALAYALAKDGWRVHVIERDLTEPDRIVGEFLHAGGCIKLAELGLEDCLDGSDSQIVFSFAAVHKDGKRSAISYPSNASERLQKTIAVKLGLKEQEQHTSDTSTITITCSTFKSMVKFCRPTLPFYPSLINQISCQMLSRDMKVFRK